MLREYLSRYLLNHWTFVNETWYVGASSWPGVSCKMFGFLSSRSSSQCGPISSRNNLLKFLTFCNQTWYIGASSQARGLCDKCWLLCWRSRSQWRFKSSWNILFVLTISSEPLYLSFKWNLVCWCIIMTWSVIWKVWDPIFKRRSVA